MGQVQGSRVYYHPLPVAARVLCSDAGIAVVRYVHVFKMLDRLQNEQRS